MIQIFKTLLRICILCQFLVFFSFLFFLFFFSGLQVRHMVVSRLGVELDLRLLAYTTSHGNVGSLTHPEGPGIKPTSSWILVTCISNFPLSLRGRDREVVRFKRHQKAQTSSSLLYYPVNTPTIISSTDQGGMY